MSLIDNRRKRQRSSTKDDVVSDNEQSWAELSRLSALLSQAVCRIDSLEADVHSLKDSNKTLTSEVKELKEKNESFIKENKSLRWSLDTLAETVESKWEYDAQVPSDSYWEEKRFEYDDIENVNNSFFKPLKETVSNN